MAAIGHNSVLRCDVGTRVSHRTRACTITRIESFDRVVLCDDVTGDELSANPHDVQLLNPAQVPEVRDVSEKELKRAVSLTGMLLPFVDRKIGADALAVLKRRTKLGKTRIYECLRELRVSPCPAAIVRAHGGYPLGKSRLHPAVETIISEEIRKASRASGARTITSIFEAVELKCVERGLTPPSARAVRLRVGRQRHELLRRRKRGKRRAVEECSALPGTMERGAPLEMVEIDHSPLDITLVDSIDRQPIGRAQLSLVTDVATSGYLGFHLGLDGASLLTAGLAFTHAVLPKEQWLIDHGLEDASWPMYGVPKKVRTDSGAEFTSPQFRAACKPWGIEHVLRKKKEDGAIVERGIGKIQARAALEFGATGSDPKKVRGEPDPAQFAHMTIWEAERWVAREITGRFHRARNDELGMSANQAWVAAHTVNDELRLPAVVSNQKAFFISFLPSVTRSINHDGIRLFCEKYYCSELRAYVGDKKTYKVHYDPRRMGRLYVEVGPATYITVPYADASKPCLPLFEIKARRARIKAAFPNEFDRAGRTKHNAAQEADRRSSRSKTRAARRKERLYQAAVKAGADAPPPEQIQVRKRSRADAGKIDWTQPAKVNSGGEV